LLIVTFVFTMQRRQSSESPRRWHSALGTSSYAAGLEYQQRGMTRAAMF
jgi:hypothetical protein